MQNMKLRAVPIGWLFSANGNIVKVTGRAPGGDVSGHMMAAGADGALVPNAAAAFDTAQVPGMLDTDGQAAPDPSDPAPAQVVQNAFPQATPVTVPAVADPAPSTPATQPGASALSRVVAGQMQNFGDDRVPGDARALAANVPFRSLAGVITTAVPSGPELVKCIDALIIARDAAVRAALAQ